MPEIVPAAASTDAASSSSSPASTSDIAASVIADMESANEPAKQATEPAVTGAAKPDTSAVKADTQPDIDPDDFDAIPAEATDSLGRKRVNSIPHPRVQKMIEKKVAARERELVTTLAKELGISKAEAELKLDDILGGVKERGAKLTDFEARFETISAVEAIMANEPARFLEILPTVNPEYARLLKREVQAAAAQPANDDPEPEPDFDLGNGQKTYSLEGMRKVRAWERRQGKRETESLLNERLGPLETERKQAAEAAKLREDAQRLQSEHSAKFEKRLERARKWPQFTEHEKDIRAHIEAERAKGNFVPFEDAYIQIVMPKIAVDHTKVRQQVIAEQNAIPHSSSVASTVTAKADDKPRTTADIAREIMAQFADK